MRTCAHCLEGGLRTLNLYKAPPFGMDCPYLMAADILGAWNKNEPALAFSNTAQG